MEHRRKTRFRGGARSQRAASRLLSTLVPNFGCGSAALYYTRSNSSQAAKVSRGGSGTPACRVDTHVDACSEFGCGSAALWDRPSFFVACLLPQASSTERSHEFLSQQPLPESLGHRLRFGMHLQLFINMPHVR